MFFLIFVLLWFGTGWCSPGFDKFAKSGQVSLTYHVHFCSKGCHRSVKIEGFFFKVRGKSKKSNWTFVTCYLCSEQWPDGSSTVSDGEADRFIHAKVSDFLKVMTTRVLQRWLHAEWNLKWLGQRLLKFAFVKSYNTRWLTWPYYSLKVGTH